MKYNQPYGVSDPNAAYINGDPTTGTMGSIPPAASIEFPQREIVNFITSNGLSPTNADLLQLAKAVQIGKVNYGNDAGAPNQIAFAPVVPCAAYVLGMHFIVTVGYQNTSAVTVNVNGLGPKPLIKTDFAPLVARELRPGQLIHIAYDGTQFQMLSGGIGIVTMSASADAYVNPTTGSDTNYDGTSATAGSGRIGPFQTIPRAISEMQKYNLGGWNFYIHLADGTYTQTSAIVCPLPNGSGAVVVTGNPTNPSAVSVFNTGTGSVIKGGSGGYWVFDGIKVRGTNPEPADQGNGFWFTGGTLGLGSIVYDSVPATHIGIGANGACVIGFGNDLAQTIVGSAGRAHMLAYWGGSIITSSQPSVPSMNILNPVTMSGFVSASGNGVVAVGYSSITGAANVTGQKYVANGNGVIDTGGQGVNYLPGTLAGSVATGGQYL